MYAVCMIFSFGLFYYGTVFNACSCCLVYWHVLEVIDSVTHVDIFSDC